MKIKTPREASQTCGCGRTQSLSAGKEDTFPRSTENMLSVMFWEVNPGRNFSTFIWTHPPQLQGLSDIATAKPPLNQKCGLSRSPSKHLANQEEYPGTPNFHDLSLKVNKHPWKTQGPWSTLWLLVINFFPQEFLLFLCYKLIAFLPLNSYIGFLNTNTLLRYRYITDMDGKNEVIPYENYIMI